MTKKQLNQWLKNNLPVFARVVGTQINQFTIGADASVDLRKFTSQIQAVTNARSVESYGLPNYLTVNL